jgi:ABC-2 type transport system permease protein
MFAEFKNTLRRLRGQIIGWGLGLFLYDFMMKAFYKNMAEMGAAYIDLLEGFPEEMIAFFPSIFEIASPVGYMDTYFFSWMVIIIGIFTIGACGNLLIKDEEKGILDLVMSYPVSRAKVFWGRFTAYLTATVCIMIVSWLGWLVPIEGVDFGLSAIEMLYPFLPLLAILLLFGALALMLSMLLPAVRIATGLTGAILVANFLLVGMSNINEDLESIYKLTPFYYFQGGRAINGIDWSWLMGLLVFTILFVLVAWWRYHRRDIRVGGEGGWEIPRFSFGSRSSE